MHLWGKIYKIRTSLPDEIPQAEMYNDLPVIKKNNIKNFSIFHDIICEKPKKPQNIFPLIFLFWIIRIPKLSAKKKITI